MTYSVAPFIPYGFLARVLRFVKDNRFCNPSQTYDIILVTFTNCKQCINLPVNGHIYVLIMFRNLRNPNFCLGRTILKRTKRKGKKHQSSKRISLIYHMTNTTLQRTVSIFQAQTFYVSYPLLVPLNI